MSALASVSDLPATNIIVAVTDNPSIVLLDTKRFEQFYEAIKEETDKLVPDLTTEKGRKEIASMAFKVAKTKTAIDAAGKLLNEDARAKINLVDAARRDIRDRLDALKDEVRRPLTEWEAREEQRVIACNGVIDRFIAAGKVHLDDTTETVRTRLAEVQAVALDDGQFQQLHALAIYQQQTAVDALTSGFQRLAKEEADRAELNRLRAEAAERAEREQAESEAKAAAEAVERQRVAAKAQAAAAEARITAAAKAAEDAARQAAEAKANEERLAQQRAHDEALAAEKRRADEAEVARKAQEAHAVAKQQAADHEAEAKRKADEARAADIEHRGRIMGAAKAAIMSLGIGEAAAKSLVLAIAAGEVPAVSIQF